MRTYIIIDWAGNKLFNGKEFKNLNDALEYMYENVDNTDFDKSHNEDDDVFQDLYVIESK
jgi:hypothetical protein